MTVAEYNALSPALRAEVDRTRLEIADLQRKADQTESNAEAARQQHQRAELESVVTRELTGVQFANPQARKDFIGAMLSKARTYGGEVTIGFLPPRDAIRAALLTDYQHVVARGADGSRNPAPKLSDIKVGMSPEERKRIGRHLLALRRQQLEEASV